MSRRSVLGVVLLIAGVCCFVLIWRSIGWMVDGGLRDYLQLAGLFTSLIAAMGGVWLLFDELIERILRKRASR